MQKYILVIDEGTTSTKAFLFDHRLKVVARKSEELEIFASKGTYVEQDAEEILRKSIKACSELIQDTAIAPSQISCIGITNQRGTAVCWDRDSGSPLCRCITWQDCRTNKLCRRIYQDGWGKRVAKTMNSPDSSQAILNLAWLLENDPKIKKAHDYGQLMYGTLDTWLIYKLTGNKTYVVSASNTSMFHGYDYLKSAWDTAYLSYLGIDYRLLPKVVDDIGDFGVTSEDLFGVPVPITCALADQQSASFAHRTLQSGQAKCTCGTGAFIDLCVGEKFRAAPAGLTSVLTYAKGDKTCFQLEGVIKTAGAILKWLRDEIRLIESYDDIEEILKKTPSSQGVIFLPALTGTGAPYWNGNEAGRIDGMRRGTTRGHVLRAMLESVAFRMKEICDFMEDETKIPINILRIDGGMCKSDEFCRIVADVLNIVVERPEMNEATGAGTALAAGLQIGLWSEHEANSLCGDVTRFYPDAQRTKELQDVYAIWRSAWRDSKKQTKEKDVAI